MRISDWSSDVCSSDLLGARVSLLEMHRVLGRDDPEIVAFARRQLAADGVEIHEGIAISRVARDGNAIAVTLETDGMTTTLTGSHLLVAAGARKCVVWGKRVSVRLALGGGRIIKQKNKI